MKTIEIDDALYNYIASNTQSIGESASDILYRLLNISPSMASVSPAYSDGTHHSNSDRMLGRNNMIIAELKKLLPEPTSHGQRLSETTSTEKTAVEINQPEKKVKHRTAEAIDIVLTRVQKALTSDSFIQETKAVNRFLMILTALYRADPENFSQATESVQGRTRIYFARDESTLLEAGEHTKPKQIPETPYWVITNNNSQRKLLMLEGIMVAMSLPESMIRDVGAFFS